LMWSSAEMIRQESGMPIFIDSPWDEF